MHALQDLHIAFRAAVGAQYQVVADSGLCRNTKCEKRLCTVTLTGSASECSPAVSDRKRDETQYKVYAPVILQHRPSWVPSLRTQQGKVEVAKLH